MNSETVGVWFTGLATALASVVALVIALYQESRRENWRRKNLRPDLVVLTSPGPPDCVAVPFVEHSITSGQPTIKRADSYYLRMLVRNTGNATARNVEVYANRLSVLKNRKWETVADFPPMNLVWSNSPPEPHFRERTYLAFLPPGSSRHCDIAHMVHPSRRHLFESEGKPGGPPVALTFELIAKPLHFGHIVGPGKYHLDIEIAAENFDAVSRVLEISLDGDWKPEAPEMFAEHLRIGMLPSN